MSTLEPFKIDLKGLDDGLTKFAFSLDRAFFEAVEAQDVSDGDVQVALDVQRTGSVFTLDFHVGGTVVVACDLCLDDMELPIAGDYRLSAKFGEENAEDDDLITVAESEGILDTAWLVYEQVALAIPIKHVHAPGKCNVAMTRKFEELSAARSSDEGEPAMDPRWSALLNLKKE